MHDMYHYGASTQHNEALLEDNASIRIMRSDRICMIGSGFSNPPLAEGTGIELPQRGDCF